MRQLDVKDACPECENSSGLPFDAWPDDAFNCTACGVRLNVCGAVWGDPVGIWVRTEASIRAELMQARANR